MPRKPSKREQFTDIHAIADKAMRAVQRAFVAHIGRQVDRVDIGRVTRALENRVPDAAVAALGLNGQQPLPAELRRELLSIFELAALAAAAHMAGVSGVTIGGAGARVPPGGVGGGLPGRRHSRLVGVFDLLNPHSVEHINRYNFRLIRLIDDKTREGVREYLREAFVSGRPPATLARDLVGRVNRATGRREGGIIGLLPRQQRQVLAFRNEMFASGISGDRLDRMVMRFANRKLFERGENIARTETIRAAAEGQSEFWEQMSQKGLLDATHMRKVWITTPDDRLCPICRPIPADNPIGVAINGGIFSTPVGGRANPPAHPRCLPGDALVTAGGAVTAATKRKFDGEVIVIRTAAGCELRATPNHPVLTRRGWVAAQFVDVGEQVVCDDRSQRASSLLYCGYQDVEAPIHDVAESFLSSREVTTVPVPTASPDFHGDGIDDEIAIVGTNRELMERLDSTVPQQSAERGFYWRDADLGRIFGACDFHAMLVALFLPAHGIMRGLGEAVPLFGARPIHAGLLLLATPTQVDTMFTQDAIDDIAVDPVQLCNAANADATGVEFDDVVLVERRDFRGHVYNLETENHLIMAGGIVTHNCRCATGLKEFTDEQLRGVPAPTFPERRAA